eukprot:TRINITY_DN8565_c0_g1_i1.p1 TRINITY_DN8565_c0_g1~~TRINITY_DN8565_c0_g1_i1.p1  ORF type:complete len:243 (+),score=40.82 TRINITY_DN8565_c0_g1_i1:52-780(+)
MKRYTVLAGRCLMKQSRSVSSYSFQKSAQPLGSATKEEIDALGQGMNETEQARLSTPPRSIGFVGIEGDIIPSESAKNLAMIKAEWNFDAGRAQLVREELGVRLVAWVKGGQYLQKEVNKIGSLADAWDEEYIDKQGGVLVMTELGRIPGEAAKTMSVSEAVLYMMEYDIVAPLGTRNAPAWLSNDDAIKADVEKRRVVLRAATFCAILSILGMAVYNLLVWLERQKNFKKREAYTSPSLNK